MTENPFRLGYRRCREVLTERLAEPAPSRLQLLFEFCRRYPRHRPLVLCDGADRTTVERLGAQALSWREFLLGGPPGAGT